MNAVEESIHDNHINVLKVVFPHLRVFISLVEGVEEWREVGKGGQKGRRAGGEERRGGEEEIEGRREGGDVKGEEQKERRMERETSCNFCFK